MENLQYFNPFVPGAGKKPKELVGRDHELEIMDRLLARTKLDLIDQGMVFSGLRGMGKTVLLRRFAQMVDEQDMIGVYLEADGDEEREYDVLFNELMMGVNRVGDDSLRNKLTEGFEHVSKLSFNFGVVSATIETGSDKEKNESKDATQSIGKPYRLELLIERVSTELAKNHSGLFLFIDEFQEMATPVMSALLSIQHKMGQRDLPFFIIGAGLPNLPGILTRARSYAERMFEYRQLSALDDEATREGFQKPATEIGRPFEEAALTELTTLAKGYPYFIQAFGKAAWNASESNPIGVSAVEKGKPEAYESLDRGLFISRWQRASDSGRNYLAAMASAGMDSIPVAFVQDRLGKTASEASMVRHELIELGLIYSPERGRVAFTVPGMDDYINRVLPVPEQVYEK